MSLALSVDLFKTPEWRENDILDTCTALEARDLPRDLEDCVLRVILVTRLGGENYYNSLFQASFIPS